MRLAAYAGTSALVAAGALLKAFHQRPNFYSATVYLSQSNACVLILTNLALVTACTFIYALQRLFYGPLRPIEIEHLSEKAWYAVLDTLLAMPSLRDEVGGWMLAVFVLLLAGKVWSWIGEGRVDILEQQPPQNPRLFHTRLASSLLVSTAFSAAMLRYCIATVKDDPRPGMMVIFTFEFAILLIFSLFTLLRYVLALTEARVLKQQTKAKMDERRAEIRAERERLEQEREVSTDPDSLPPLPSEEDVDENEIDVPGWEEKRRWLFGLELATDFIKLIVYTVFFGISLTFMGLPMHIIRDVYLTFASFVKRVQDYNNYRKATQNMNSRYPDATSEELTNDNTCIVCREVMVPWNQPDAAGQTPRPSLTNEGMRAKKLPCGHILHLRCLKAWLERQQACPTCRRPVIPTGTSATDRAGAADQNANGGANGGAQQGANAQAGAPNANGNANRPAQPRLRMLNLGPIRIGVYNGPANRVQDALNHRRAQDNGNATGAATPAASSGIGGLAGARSTDTQLQLLQVEERLMQESRRLTIEQAQLATVRALEAELARLRAYYSHNQAGIGAPAPSAAARPAIPNLFPTPHTMGPGASFAQPQVFQPGPGQAPMTQGHEALPSGLVLPEGWTLVPLNRVEGTAQPGNGMPQTEVPVPTPTVVIPQVDAPAQQEGTEQVMPLSSLETAAANQSVEQVPDDFSAGASEEAPAETIAEAQAQTSESSTQQTDSEEQPTTVDKGKGRAVTVEDVEDAEQ
ncbi:hypothetical protein M436DRAFT_36366 [Aureobasidium namibiae CBS 147.97]|uniref:RING-type E3 ubiquitin transferase n=1 Tax=Aureobasidium namibiae CBS 147.97 TaxID=1043004 RepID=A0A074WVY1_9PEZI|nr:uncharacterized protein M436DRAFT_36366 [Aureobasidium namibiae CBS 147.97]KEQ77370.1 hypothetical protein M436DRAFT_36366 [Aureobasidium namibiae CBS 147.97]